MYTFKEERITLKGECDLGATLTIPDTGKEKMPAVVIVVGTGKADRDGNVPKMEMNVYKMLSDFLAGLGFVTIRYDKRGIAESKGDFLKTSMNDLVNDIITNVKYLESLSCVDQKRIVLLGHSEGCILTTVASQRYPVGGLVLVAGAGITLKTAMMNQNIESFHEAEFSRGLLGFIVRNLLTEKKTLAKVEKFFNTIQKSDKDVIRVQMVKFPAKWLREHLAFSDDDILKMLSETSMPVLAITGDKDVQASSDHLKKVAALSKANITCAVVPNMDHILREFTGEKSVMKIKKQYMSEVGKPLNATFLATLSQWAADNVLVG
ncbi:MAG: alpha/beta hydrolase [Clostridia bacterium]|nr:alpha/beta hydrolase [Clostridia bacterium]